MPGPAISEAHPALWDPRSAFFLLHPAALPTGGSLRPESPPTDSELPEDSASHRAFCPGSFSQSVPRGALLGAGLL